ncbi:hypothetical protein AVEN_174774-1 [Araneus ventricosus]|uniref:Uncharacterized protein n=1 Tax=Araneus ventricosus TaxID=182803 RepID=A0A4Y2BMP3_ARAVE|nr:hypothetical protein AVEN_174774-1 [Araneus ventricosus]
MTALNSIVSPHFVDLYMSFLTSLLDAGPKGLSEIYEFSAQYFENKLKERSGETKKNDKRETIFQRDVPNSPGKKQFLPDFSYDSVLILPPKLIPPFTSFEENKENLLNKERQVIRHLNDSPNHQKQGRNLLSKPQAFQENEGISRLANRDIDQDEHRQAFLEDQAMLKKEREIAEKMYHDKQQKKCSGSIDNDSKAQREQKIILDLEKLLKEENQEKSMDHDGDRKDSFKILFKDFDVFDKASNTEVDLDAFQNRFCTARPNHCAVSQKERKKNVDRKDQLEKQNIPPLDLHKNKMRLQMSTPERSNTFIDAQFSNGSKVLNQIVEFSKLLPVCLEVMSKMINGLEEKSHSPEVEIENSYFTSDRLEIHERCPATLDESCRNDVDKQKTSDKIFRTTASQTDLVGSSELMKINSSILTPAMLEYVCDVVKAAKRLLHSVTVKNYNHLPIEKITGDLPMSYGSEIGFNEFEKILEFWKDCLNKSENVPIQIDQNCIHESLVEQYSDSQRDSEEDMNAWQYESNKEPQYCQFHRKSNSNLDDGKDFNHPCDHQIAQNRNGRIYSPVQEDICQEREKCRDECELGKEIIKKRDQNSSSSNESCSSTESSNHSSVENQKILDGINDLRVGCSNDDLSKSISDSVISSHSNQDANKNDLAFLSKLEKIYQTNKYEDPFFRSSPGIIQVSAHEPSAKGIERTHKSTGDLPLKQIVGKSKPEKLKEGKAEHKEKESFSLLDPCRSTINNEKEKMKNLLNYYKIHYNGYPKDKHGECNHIKKPIYYQSSSDTDEDIKENAQRALIDSEQRGPIHKDSSQFFISTPGIRKLQNLSKPVEVKKTPKSTGNLSKKEAVQWYGPRKRFTRMSTPKDKLQDPGVNGFFSLLDPKRSVTGIKASSYPKLFQDVGSTAVEAEIDDDGSTKIVVHEIHQATSKLQMRILKARRVYKEAVSKTRTDRDAKDLDDNWRNIGVPVTGRSWLRSYFTTRMIRKYQKQLETDKIDNEIEDLSTPVLKHRECSYGLGSYFSQRSLFGSVRMWYFSRKLREYQRAFNS